MAIDLAAMRAKLAKLSGKGNDALFKPEEGENIVRILPLASQPGNPFQEMFFHYGLGGKNYLSPMSYGERDPIAEFSDALISTGPRLSKDEFKEAKKFYPQTRTYALVVVRGKEAEGLKYWSFGQGILTKLLSVIDDDDYGDITDPEKGFDLKVTYTPKEKSDTTYAKTDVAPRRSPTALSSDPETLKKWLTEQPDLLEIIGFERKSFAELQTILERVLNPEAPVSLSSGTQKGGSTPAAAPAASPAQETSEWDTPTKAEPVAKPAVSDDVSKQFDELFNT
jgi:hypothetical protein